MSSVYPPSTYLELVKQVTPQNLYSQEIQKVSNFSGSSLSSKREEEFRKSIIKPVYFEKWTMASPQIYEKIVDLGQNFWNNKLIWT